MKNEPNGGEAIRLTNKTARALREQAKQQRFALQMTATVLSVVLAAAAVVLGMRRILYVPVTVLVIILLDALLILLARGRYLSLTGQAICTEAAARQMRGESAQEMRVKTARRDLEKIKADLAASFEEEDEDLTLPVKKSPSRPVTLEIRREETARSVQEAPAQTTVMEPVLHRRRQPRLQMISSDQAK